MLDSTFCSREFGISEFWWNSALTSVIYKPIYQKKALDEHFLMVWSDDHQLSIAAMENVLTERWKTRFIPKNPERTSKHEMPPVECSDTCNHRSGKTRCFFGSLAAERLFSFDTTTRLLRRPAFATSSSFLGSMTKSTSSRCAVKLIVSAQK